MDVELSNQRSKNDSNYSGKLPVKLGQNKFGNSTLREGNQVINSKRSLNRKSHEEYLDHSGSYYSKKPSILGFRFLI